MNDSTKLPAVALSVDQLLQQCEITFTRRSGPGGQHRNKVSTAVVIKHIDTGTIAEASERRSQADNRREAASRLRIELALHCRDDLSAVAPELIERYGGRALRVSPSNEHFPIVLADLLNRILSAEGMLHDAAETWKTSTSQIVRLLKTQPRAIAMVNGCREQAGKRPLK